MNTRSLSTPITSLVLATLACVTTALTAVTSQASTTQATERVIWNKRPIEIVLTVGSERLVSFPTIVTYWIPPDMGSKLRDPQSLEGTLYLTATEPFERARIVVRECTPTPDTCAPSGRTYLLDVSAVAQGGERAPIQVFAPQTAPDDTPQDGEAQRPAKDSKVTLSQYAAQQLYAPSRLIRAQAGIVRVPLRVHGPLNLYAAGGIDVSPHASWSDGVLFVTAVLLTNRTPRSIPIDPRLIRGRWLSRSWLHSRLLPAGDPSGADSAPVLLISPRPFSESIHE